jgi:galactokinase
MHQQLASLFYEQFGSDPIIVRSPGRINIIGEHTDYNEGFVLPAAIDKYAYVAVAKNNLNNIRAYSALFNERIDISLDALIEKPDSWITYGAGVAREMQIQEQPISGFDIIIDGDIPVGAGLSSSAALCCAITKALIALFDFELHDDDIIGIARSAEHNFAGVMCGIMDQTASVKGKKDHALLLDCQSRAITEVPLRVPGYQWVLLNTNVKHSLASSEYNTRRQECHEAVDLIQRHLPRVTSLREVTINMLIQYVHHPRLLRRARYVLEENDRVQRAVRDLSVGNVTSLGHLLYQSHQGLSQDYEVSCCELDWLVAHTRVFPAVAGARMMGGGFGGCTINLIKEGHVETIVQQLSMLYLEAFERQLEAYMVQTANGSEIVHSTLQQHAIH